MINLLNEPCGRTYRSILGFAAECCSEFSLTWRDGVDFGDGARRVLAELGPWQVREVRTDHWPGTQLRACEATVRFFFVKPGAIAVLNQVDGLYSWRAPSLPEDLAFYTKTGACWLGSIAHERDSWLDLSPTERAALRFRVPGLQVDSQ